jgi:hypothetical protein
MLSAWQGDGPRLLGSPLRDAAVDPRPGDYGVPVNAGKANPRGPDVRARRCPSCTSRTATREHDVSRRERPPGCTGGPLPWSTWCGRNLELNDLGRVISG